MKVTIELSEHPVHHEDPFTDADLVAITRAARRLTRIGNAYYGDPDVVDLSRPRNGIDWANPATREFADMVPGLAEWLDTVPTAAALDPLYRPDSRTLPDGRPIRSEIARWFRNLADGRGIRSRGQVLQDLLVREAHTHRHHSQAWLSLACGAAQPLVAAMRRIDAAGLPLPTGTLADLDRNALDLAVDYAARHSLAGQLHPLVLNILRRTGFGDTLAPNSFDVVEAIGIFEYLRREDGAYAYDGVLRTAKRLAGAETFLARAYELVRPGGLLVIGNMLTDHPQLGFTLNVVQWPHIRPRSPQDIVDIARAAGAAGSLEIIRPSDGVYALYALRKPSLDRP